jgi:hypothetical protein
LETLGLAALLETRGDDWRLRPEEHSKIDDVETQDKFFDDEGNEVDPDSPAGK